MLTTHLVKYSTKKLLHNLLVSRPLNYIGSRIFKTIPIRYSAEGRYVFPVRGEILVKYPSFGNFTMLSSGNDSIASRAFYSGALDIDRATSRTLSTLFSQSERFFDIGANTGLFSLMAACHKNIKEVHSFEPVPQVYNHLKLNIVENKHNHVKSHQLALGEQTEETNFQIPNGILLPVGSSAEGSLKWYPKVKKESVKVSTVTIDDFLEINKISPPDLYKIDTETTEASVLRGAKRTLENSRPVIVVEILRDSVGKEISQIFKDKNYFFFHITDTGLEEHKGAELYQPQRGFNYLLLPKEKHHLRQLIENNLQ